MRLICFSPCFPCSHFSFSPSNISNSQKTSSNMTENKICITFKISILYYASGFCSIFSLELRSFCQRDSFLLELNWQERGRLKLETSPSYLCKSNSEPVVKKYIPCMCSTFIDPHISLYLIKVSSSFFTVNPIKAQKKT